MSKPELLEMLNEELNNSRSANDEWQQGFNEAIQLSIALVRKYG